MPKEVLFSKVFLDILMTRDQWPRQMIWNDKPGMITAQRF